MPMAYETLFTTEDKQVLYSKLKKFKELHIHVCHLWYGATDSAEYGIIRPTFRLKRQFFNVHHGCHFYNIYHVSH